VSAYCSYCDSGYWVRRAESAEEQIRLLEEKLREARVATQFLGILREVVKEVPSA
jgi:hypothetical protein